MADVQADLNKAPPLRIAQISDMHLQDDPTAMLRGVEVEARFLATLNAVEQQNVDMLLLTGDLTHHAANAYGRLAKHLQTLSFPTYWIPGNHDLAGEMARYALFGFGRKVIETRQWRILLLDSTANPDGRGSGALSEQELEFLATELEAADEAQSILIALHHHPVSVQSEWQDQIMLANADQFWSIVDRSSQVSGVIFGHVHQALEMDRNGLKLFSVPATAAQFKRATVHSETENDPVLSQPAYAIYQLHRSGEIEVQVTRVSG